MTLEYHLINTLFRLNLPNLQISGKKGHKVIQLLLYREMWSVNFWDVWNTKSVISYAYVRQLLGKLYKVESVRLVKTRGQWEEEEYSAEQPASLLIQTCGVYLSAALLWLRQNLLDIMFGNNNSSLTLHIKASRPPPRKISSGFVGIA